MQINSPEELIKAINALLMQMDRPGRKRFYMWIKQRRKMYDFQYPEGYKFKEEENATINDVKVAVTPDVINTDGSVAIIKPDSGILIPDNSTPSH